MTLLEQVEMLREAIAAGLIHRADAVDLLVELSNGGLTHLGAAGLIGDPRLDAHLQRWFP